MTKEKFQVYALIDKKKKGEKLTKNESKWFIQSFTDGIIPDYQMTAMLMAMFIRGMDVEETAALTDAMLESGEQLKFTGKNVIDKHSTGRSEEHTSELQSRENLVCRLLLEKKKNNK